MKRLLTKRPPMSQDSNSGIHGESFQRSGAPRTSKSATAAQRTVALIRSVAAAQTGCHRSAHAQPDDADPLRIDGLLGEEVIDGADGVGYFPFKGHLFESALGVARASKVEAEHEVTLGRQRFGRLDKDPVGFDLLPGEAVTQKDRGIREPSGPSGRCTTPINFCPSLEKETG